MNTIVLYHAMCADGLGAALAAYRYLSDNAEYKAIAYHDPVNPEDYRDKTVYLVDFSFKRDIYLTVKAIAKEVIVLDHHKSAAVELEGLVEIDQTKSGAVLAWEYFNQSEPLPEMYSLLQDYDLWTHEYKESHWLNAYFKTFLLHLTVKEVYEHLEDVSTSSWSELIAKGKAIFDYMNQQAETTASRAHFGWFDEYVLPVVNCSPDLISLTGNILASKYGIALLYYNHEGRTHCSLRSVGNIDVSVIAVRHGGGGHKNAAGFVVKDLGRTLIPTPFNRYGNPTRNNIKGIFFDSNRIVLEDMVNGGILTVFPVLELSELIASDEKTNSLIHLNNDIQKHIYGQTLELVLHGDSTLFVSKTECNLLGYISFDNAKDIVVKEPTYNRDFT